MVSWTSSDLPVAIYLNQRIVFDLLAIFEDGLMQMRTETVQVGAELSDTVSGEMTAGSGGALAKFFNVSIKGAGTKAKKGTDTRHEAGQRAHTPASLFSSLRSYLQDESLLQHLTDDTSFTELKNGIFVEFRSTLHKNPLVDTLQAFKELMSMANTFDDSNNNQNPKSARKTNTNPSSNRKPIGQIDALLTAVTAKGNMDLVGEVSGVSGVKCVITVEPASFIESSMNDTADGEFQVLGKVVQILREGQDGGINLMRKTALSQVPDDIVESLIHAINSAEITSSARAMIQRSIKAPVIQVIPIAIFV